MTAQSWSWAVMMAQSWSWAVMTAQSWSWAVMTPLGWAVMTAQSWSWAVMIAQKKLLLILAVVVVHLRQELLSAPHLLK
eukprot:9989746-Ditylum_brightwellii.AAC.1